MSAQKSVFSQCYAKLVCKTKFIRFNMFQYVGPLLWV
jgi:hypothetical protein